MRKAIVTRALKSTGWLTAIGGLWLAIENGHEPVLYTLNVANQFSDKPLTLPEPGAVPVEFWAGLVMLVIGALFANYFSDDIEFWAALEASEKERGQAGEEQK